MSINPASDIVLDVARAADPGASLAAMQRLSRLGLAEPATGFASALAQTEPAEPGDGELRGRIATMNAAPAPAAGAPTDDRAKAYKGLEQLVLQRLVETMLPNEESGVFGSGTAGDVWRSMLAEQLAKQIGKTVDLGLVKTVAGTHRATPEAGHAAALAGAPALRRS